MIIREGAIVYDDNQSEYEVIEFIGNGSFGYVFKINKSSDGSLWALKSLPSSIPTEDQLKSFKNESQLATRVAHPNATKYIYVHDGETYSNLPPYIIMEYANGGTLQDLIKKQTQQREFFSDSVLLGYFHQLINGMEHVNSLLVHRDIKPDNILINDNIIKITDFGLAKVAGEGTRQATFKGFGHLHYMAPESWKSEKNTIQMDIYAMGITFYQLATLSYPYDIKTNIDLWTACSEAHLLKNPKSLENINPNLNLSIIQVIMKMLEKSTTKRYQCWEAIRNDLKLVNAPMTENSSFIDNLINIQLSKDNASKEAQLRAERLKKEKEEYMSRIFYQFINDIYSPLKQLIDEFNTKYTSGKIILTHEDTLTKYNMDTSIKLVSGNQLKISLVHLFDENFVREIPPQFEYENSVKKVVRPTLRNRKVLAWGSLINNDKQGFNILLLESSNDIYGEWYTIENTNNWSSRRQRTEPFPFDFNEIEDELTKVDVTHIYNSDVKVMEFHKFQEYLIRSMY